MAGGPSNAITTPVRHQPPSIMTPRLPVTGQPSKLNSATGHQLPEHPETCSTISVSRPCPRPSHGWRAPHGTGPGIPHQAGYRPRTFLFSYQHRRVPCGGQGLPPRRGCGCRRLSRMALLTAARIVDFASTQSGDFLALQSSKPTPAPHPSRGPVIGSPFRRVGWRWFYWRVRVPPHCEYCW